MAKHVKANPKQDNGGLSPDTVDELREAWLSGAISDETMDELDPDGLVQDDQD